MALTRTINRMSFFDKSLSLQCIQRPGAPGSDGASGCMTLRAASSHGKDDYPGCLSAHQVHAHPFVEPVLLKLVLPDFWERGHSTTTEVLRE